MPDAVRWLTYDEVARELGITRDSARQLAIRKRWARQKGNDGRAKIGIPEEELQARTADVTPQAPSDRTSQGLSDDTGADPSVIQVLTRHISRLETELETLKEERAAERDRVQGEVEALRGEHAAVRGRLQVEVDALRIERDAERLRGAQLEALNGILEIERKRISEAQQRADDARQQIDELRAERARWVAATETAQAEIARITAKAREVEQRRGWWPWRRRA